jgi:hypothetical protein
MKKIPLRQRYEDILGGNRLAISFMTVAELYEGACRANWAKNASENWNVRLDTTWFCHRQLKFAAAGRCPFSKKTTTNLGRRRLDRRDSADL